MEISPDVSIPEDDYFDYFYDKPGSEPGTIKIDSLATPSRLVLIDYNEDNAYRRINPVPQDCLDCLTNNLVSWGDIQGLGSENILREVAEVFQLHPLLLEDVVNVPQRPKLEDYPEQILIIVHSLKPNLEDLGFKSQQIGFVLGKNYLLTFQEDKEDYFDLVRERIKNNQGKVRTQGADYLLYLLLDAIIDSYFPVLEDYGEIIEKLEDNIVFNQDNHHILQQIYQIRRELLALRRSIWPLRNLFNALIREDSELINKDVYVYLRDCYYHIIQLLDILETYRELASSLMDVQISIMSHKMNEVISLLTIISSIFIPLTFIAGIYGMNFQYMPELNLRWAYFACLGVMFIIALSLIIFFWKKGWLKFSSLDQNSRSKF